MSPADILVAVVLLVCGVIALRLGLVRVVLGLAGWVGASLVTIYGFSTARPFAREWIGGDLIADIAAGATLFIISMIVLTFISHAVSGSVRESGFGALDRSLGLVAGLAIGGVLISSGYALSKQVFNVTDDWSFYRDARSLPLVKRGASSLLSMAPSGWGIQADQPKTGNADETFRTLLEPKTEPAGPKPKPGYNTNERQEMDRLFRSHQ